jgi:phage terminase small subunit
MGKLPNTLKLSQHLTPKQKKFAEVMVAKWGQITKAEAAREAGYTPKRENGASELGSKLTNPNKNPHVVRYIEKLRAAETFKWEKDKLRSYKQFDRMREGAIEKNQFNAAINAEKSIGQMAGFFVNKSEVNVIGLEGMSPIDPSRKVLSKSIRVPLSVFQGSRTTNHQLSFSVLINLNGSSWISYSFPPPGSSR